jgi:glycosyltransferase involved in cell wall biosynthesis
MKIAHREGRIVGTGAAQGNWETVEIDTDLEPKELLADWKVREGQLVPKRGGGRVALVSVWGVPCGISTYSEYLWEHLKEHADEGMVFAEREPGYTDEPGVIRCWRRGEPLGELVDQIKAYDPDVIFVQHEYGYFPKATHWISFMGAMAGRNIVVTLHSVYQHPDKIVVEASTPNIIVHTNTARDILIQEKQVAGQVTVIPHGCPPLKTGRHWNLYGTPHTILQFGFGFPYKGWDNALRVVAEVKKTHPDAFFTGLLSERVPGQASNYLLELNGLARSLGISEHVGLIQGFQSDIALDSFLRTNRVALFPYRDNGGHTVYGCSGAARVAMSKGLPVIASGLAPLFDDLEGVVPRPTTVEGWAEAVLEAFDKPDISRQNQFLEDNSWTNVAERYWHVGSGVSGSSVPTLQS